MMLGDQNALRQEHFLARKIFLMLAMFQAKKQAY
jgi:hypothetical protein